MRGSFSRIAISGGDIIVASEPTELIVTDGALQYTPLAGGELLVVSNTESDVLREVASQRIYVLISGRWFSELYRA